MMVFRRGVIVGLILILVLAFFNAPWAQTASHPLLQAAAIRFAVIGDYGSGGSNEADVADLKGIVAAMHAAIGAPEPAFRAETAEELHPHLHPGRAARLFDPSGHAYGDLGVSLYHGEPVARTLISRMEPTVLLTLLATSIAIAIGLPLGIIAAVNHRSSLDLGALVTSLIGISIPNFWLGLNLILLFGLYLNWLPTAGYASVREDPLLTLQHLIMPAIALGFSQAALIARMSRANLLEVLRTDYVRTAHAKGLSAPRVILKHAMRNAMVPTVSVIGVIVTLSLGGAVITETVFAIPGVGRLMVESVFRRDFPVIQGLVLMLAAVVALANLFVDILYAYLNPQIRYD